MVPTGIRKRLAAYRMPAEWSPHQATYLVWPHNLETWPGKFEPIPTVFAKLAAALSESEQVRILISDVHDIHELRRLIEGEFGRPDHVEFVRLETNDSWIRDYGPIFVSRAGGRRGASQIALDWKFNSWGEKYGDYRLDDVVPHRLATIFGFKVIAPALVLEGGSVDVNGAGTLLTTESCLLNGNRNPRLTREEIEDYLMVFFGVTNVLWLGEGIAGDDTDGHVDDLARFTSSDTIVTVVENDLADENYKPLQDNLSRLRLMRDQNGRPFKIETLPMPRAIRYQGNRLPASYANFYIANRSVLIPTFDCPADQIAIATLSRLFPGREIVPIPSTDLVWGLGAVHCLTQQHPQVLGPT